MTLPYPDSPEITENIGTSISRIKDNLEYLDGLIGSGNIKTIMSTANVALKSGVQTITGVGFKPKAMMTFASYANAHMYSWGGATQYSTCTSIDCSCVGQRENYAGIFSQLNFARLYQSSDIYIEGSVQSFDNDGATVNWNQHGTVASGTGYLMYIFFG